MGDLDGAVAGDESNVEQVQDGRVGADEQLTGLVPGRQARTELVGGGDVPAPRLLPDLLVELPAEGTELHKGRSRGVSRQKPGGDLDRDSAGTEGMATVRPPASNRHTLGNGIVPMCAAALDQAPSLASRLAGGLAGEGRGRSSRG
jgi:hypothetical protein